ncbi:hypothetical protein GCK32_006855 [Trichostrongylus colubriformis]|uniref:Uncharacterized protein n=1 Tax=Trichostrongylus colubriformis TaxID=6319 RepID=A0AAN8F8E1_TRICO
MSTLCLPIFFAAKKQRSDATDVEGPASSSRTKDQPPKKKPKIVKPHVVYVRDAKTERTRQAYLMEQKRKHYKQEDAAGVRLLEEGRVDIS